MKRPLSAVEERERRESEASAALDAVAPAGAASGVASSAKRRLPLPPLGLVGLFIIVAWLIVTVIGPMIAPYSIEDIPDNNIFDGLSRHFPLGSDYLGRDILSRVLFGARYTIWPAAAAALLSSAIGTLLGIGAAIVGGIFEKTVARIMDTIIVTPGKIFSLVLIAALGSSIPVLILVATLSYAPGAYRVAHSQAVGLNAMDYVLAARLRGENVAYIGAREILPNMLHPMLADFGLRFVFIVLLLSALSFLGLGIQPPFADWGSMVRENIDGLSQAAPAVIAPALAIASLTVGVNLLIDSLPRRRAPRHGA